MKLGDRQCRMLCAGCGIGARMLGPLLAVPRQLQQFVHQRFLRVGQTRVFVRHPQANRLDPGSIAAVD